MSCTIVVTAGHCTFGVGLNGASTTHDGADTDAAHGGVGGNDVWISFAEAPNFDILAPSSTFATQTARYAAWSSALNASSEWHRAHRDAASALRRPRLLRPRHRRAPAGHRGHADRRVASLAARLARPVRRQGQEAHFETAGYGLAKSTGSKSIGGDTRRKSNPRSTR